MANIITELHLEMSANWYVSKKLNSVGRVGENTVTKLIIEPTEILDNVTYEIEIADADGSKNVAELTIDGTELYLILTANMLTTSGIMKMQVRGLFTDGSIKKSNIFELKVNRSISATEAYEEYAVTIFDQLVQDCRDIIEGAESYAVRAETAAVNAEAYSEAASASATTATTAASNASASATAAANSATAASTSASNANTSATNAHTSETSAASSAANASTSASNANTSATNAANSATSAATSASNAAVSATNASASETNASTSATEAAASAESIAASVSQINENTYRINDLEAIIGGYQLADLPTGAVASVTDGTALLMPSLKVGIEPVQDLHGYDHPWAGGAGKNKCDAQNPIVLSQAGNIGNQPCAISAGTYTYSWTSSENTAISLTLWNDSIQIGSFASTTAIQGRGNITFTISENATHLRCYYNGATTVSDIQVEEGSTATSYEPYSNICPISGWTAANVTRSGKNLYKAELDNYYLDTVTGLPVAEAGYEVSEFIPISANQSIYIQESGSARRWFYDKFKNPKIYLQNSDNQTYTAQEDGYVRVTLRKTISTYSTYQIEYGSTATTYEPYNGTTYTIEFKDGDNPLTVYGGTLDVVNGVLTVTDAHIASYNAETLPSTWISDRDVYAEGTTPTTGAEVVYKLANSVTYQLTPTQVRTLVGNNNIWADTGDIIEGKYYRSPS